MTAVLLARLPTMPIPPTHLIQRAHRDPLRQIEPFLFGRLPPARKRKLGYGLPPPPEPLVVFKHLVRQLGPLVGAPEFDKLTESLKWLISD